MDRDPTLAITHYFHDLPDPRLAHLCGQHSWTAIAFYGQDHAAWLQTFLRLPNGIPAHDTFRYVFTRLDPEAFQRCFAAWIEALSRATVLKHIAIDGKALRGSLDRADCNPALHRVSAWARANHLTLGQVAVADKSNEITAIPRLLEILDVTGAIVTIDAMGCQKDIAAKIREEGADYVLAVKDNQPRLLEDIQAAVNEHLERIGSADATSCLETRDVGHGRQEVRRYTLVTDLGQIRDRELWQDLHGVCMVASERTVGGETTVEARYYIGSLHGGVGDREQLSLGVRCDVPGRCEPVACGARRGEPGMAEADGAVAAEE